MTCRIEQEDTEGGNLQRNNPIISFFFFYIDIYIYKFYIYFFCYPLVVVDDVVAVFSPPIPLILYGSGQRGAELATGRSRPLP